MSLKPGLYKVSGRGSKDILSKAEKLQDFYTKGGSDSANNDFKKGPILANVEFVLSNKVYLLLATRIYSIPYAVIMPVKELLKFTLTPIDEKCNKVDTSHPLDGWRGHNTLVEWLPKHKGGDDAT